MRKENTEGGGPLPEKGPAVKDLRGYELSSCIPLLAPSLKSNSLIIKHNLSISILLETNVVLENAFLIIIID